MRVMILVVAIIVAGVSGCAQLPTMQHCDYVRYERTGNQIRVEADCRAPVGGSGMPGAML